MRFVILSGRGSRLLVIACLWAIWSPTIFAAEIEPYEARVIVARAQVRSGPGENFYPTDALAQGDSVEVYREQPDGWLAIRPPRDSFSWVFGRHLKLRDDGLAEIDKEEVASRIGSRFGSNRNAVQVQLRKGEVVEILGEEAADGETWYKIAPPAGEFRWIHATHVTRIGPLQVPGADPDAKPIVVPTSASNESARAVADEPQHHTDQSVASPPAANALGVESWRASAPGAKRSPTDLSTPPLATAVSPPPTAESRESTVPPVSAAQVPVPPADELPEVLDRSLTDIELRLSRMVAEPPGQWNTESLERETEELLAQARTADERDAVKSMLAKLDRFEAIGRQSRQQESGGVRVGDNAEITAAQVSPDIRVPAVATVDSALRPTPTRASNDAGRYDAEGILRPVVSKRPGAPQFALVDDRGQVISFVTPTPDTNLQPYLGHRIGVTGTRGFIPEFQRAHVTAGRVTPLSERILR